jgi:uncharacterized membrane-anchored protein YjiN (DUF445 family)
MEFNKENCNKLISLLTKDKENEENFDMFMDLLKSYLEMYDHLNEINVLPDTFKIDTKVMFDLIKIVYCDEEVIKEISNEDDSHFNKDEMNEYLEFVNNVSYICENIDTFNSNDSVLSDKLKNVAIFFGKKQEDMKKLNEAMDNLGNTLDEVYKTLEKIN